MPNLLLTVPSIFAAFRRPGNESEPAYDSKRRTPLAQEAVFLAANRFMAVRFPWRLVVVMVVIHCSGIAACTPMTWTKPNTDPAATQEDIRQCQQQAHLRAIRYPSLQIGSIPTATVGPGGEVLIGATPPASQSGEVQQEFDLTTNCMHQKGYKLEPLKQDQKH
jgi:hypothetical protein